MAGHNRSSFRRPPPPFLFPFCHPNKKGGGHRRRHTIHSLTIAESHNTHQFTKEVWQTSLPTTINDCHFNPSGYVHMLLQASKFDVCFPTSLDMDVQKAWWLGWFQNASSGQLPSPYSIQPPRPPSPRNNQSTRSLGILSSPSQVRMG